MARSMINQGLYLQKETTPGTPVTTAMNRVLSIKATPSYAVTTTEFMASGYKVNTSSIVETQTGTVAVDSIQDFNGALWILTGGFGAPTSTLHTAGTLSHDHTFTLNAKAADPTVSFTGMWGDSTQTFQLPYFVFNEFGITVQRGGLALKSSAISMLPITGIALPGSGVTEVPAIPIPSPIWNVYADDTWAALGTTKLLQVYSCDLTFGAKYVPDYVVNSALTSFSSLIESDKPTFTCNLEVGFDPTAIGLVSTFTTGALKFFRFEAVSAGFIETTIPYKLTLDFCARIKSPGAIAPAKNSPAVTLAFALELTQDTTSGNSAKAVLTNGITALT